MGIGAIILLVVTAAILAAGAQLVRIPGIRDPRTKYDWAIVGVVALGLGIVVGLVRQIGPQWQGLYIGPAIFGAVFWSVVVTGVLRYAARPYPEPE
ncbi:MAG TPA: hypothetical protein VKF59_06850 [Candidatus Dormibacteraeota bacterium]|nr:hypothetical protein [Candidatus Dormibacteraeota bacterium]